MTMPSQQHLTELDDVGLGLIELVVSILVSALVLIGVGSILVNAWNTQADVTSTSQATTRGQLIGSSIEKAVRNAVEFDVTGGGTQLRVGTSLSSGLRCQGFRFATVGADGTLQWSASSSALAGGAWPEWESDVVQATGPGGIVIPVFEVTGAGNAVTYTFDIETEAAPVRIRGQVAMRSAATVGSTSCW